MDTAIVRRPGPLLDSGLVTHQQRVPVDVDLAIQQWENYVAAMRSSGWLIDEVPPADDCADAVFVEDAAVLFDHVAVIARPGALPRRGETLGVEATLAKYSFDVHRISEPGTLDGGDVLKVGRTVYVGLGGRTNAAAIQQLDDLLTPRGWVVRSIPTTRVLHLKSAVTALPDGTVVGFIDDVDDASLFDRFLAMPEPSGSHVVLLGGSRLLMSSSAPQSAAMFRELGYSTTCVDISEFEKLEGCVTCLAIRHRNIDAGSRDLPHDEST